MNKRKMIGILGATVVAVPFSIPARAETKTLVVPDGAEKIRVRSYVEGDEVMDYTFSVKPGQKFRIDLA